MSGSSSPATQTSISQPPAYVLPYLQEGLNQSRNLYYRTPGGPTMAGAPSVAQPGTVGGGFGGFDPSQWRQAGRMGLYVNPSTGERLSQAQFNELRGGGYAPPSWSGSQITPAAAQAAANGNWGQFNAMQPGNYMPESSGFPEAPVIPFSPQTQTALNMAESRATAGSPVNRAAQDYTTHVLGGGFMGSNPWLDRTFNKAAGALTNQVQSNFGLAGRNARGVDAAGFAADMYGNLATDIYGGDYQAERARHQQLVPFSGQLAQQDYNDISALANVGGQYEDLARERAYAPDLALDQYLARLSGFPGSSVTATMPMERNRLAGALGGGLAGLGALSSLGLMGTPLGWGILGGSALLGAL